jgi:hypothetical protein
MTENESQPQPETTEPVAVPPVRGVTNDVAQIDDDQGAPPAPPEAVTEPAPPEPVSGAPTTPAPHPFHTEDELKNVKAVDVLGNGENETFYVDAFTGNQLRYVMTGVIIPGRNSPPIAIIDIAIGIRESEDKDPAKTEQQVCRITVPILRMLMCSKPATIRLRNNGDNAWTKIAAIVKRLPTTASYDTILAAKDLVDAPSAPPEIPPEAPAPEESKIILP